MTSDILYAGKYNSVVTTNDSLPDSADEASVSVPTTWRRTAFRLTMIGVTFLILFVVLEIGFRIELSVSNAGLEHEANQGKTWAIYDDQLGYRLRPTETNPLGLKSPQLGDKIPGRQRLLFLGDSIPHGGSSINDTMISYAQDSLVLAGYQAELINAGIPGYTTYQELEFLKKFGLGLSPDIVAVGFCVNDLHKFLHTFKVENGKIVGNRWDVAEEAAGEVHGSLYMLARKSVFLRWVRGRVRQIEKRTRFSISGGYVFDHRSDIATAWQDQPWIDYAMYLDEIISLGKTHQFRVMVVAFPYAAQYREDYLNQNRDYVLKPQLRLEQICRDRSVALLDLYDKISPETHMDSDGIHFSAAGRKEVGRQLAQFLIEQGFMP